MCERREECCECGNLTGRAGQAEDSLYTEAGKGPFCEDCFDLVNLGYQEGVDELTALTAERDKLRAVVGKLPELADGTKITGDLIGHDVWTWAFPGMFLSSFTVKRIRFAGEEWELVGIDCRDEMKVAMAAVLCCLSEVAAEVAEAAAKAASEEVV